jgi:hypothetical protein
MKLAPLLVGLLSGGVGSFFLTRSFYQLPSPAAAPSPHRAATAPVPSSANWPWPDSLDARTAAATSHQVVYEDARVRILQVSLAPKQTEPVHTHRWPSVMWFTQATPMRYYRYGLAQRQLVLRDSMSIAQLPAAVLNQGELVEAEAPHAVKNLSNRAGVAYRVEFKQGNRP